MTSREAFEAWRNPGKHAGNVSAWVAPGRYENDTHQLAWLAWQAAYEAGRTAERNECAKVCDEMRDHWSDYKDTALLNGDVALSNAASGEPRAAEFLAEAIRARGKP